MDKWGERHVENLMFVKPVEVPLKYWGEGRHTWILKIATRVLVPQTFSVEYVTEVGIFGPFEIKLPNESIVDDIDFKFIRLNGSTYVLDELILSSKFLARYPHLGTHLYTTILNKLSRLNPAFEQLIFRVYRTNRYKAMKLLDRCLELLDSGTETQGIYSKIAELAQPLPTEDIFFELQKLMKQVSLM